MRPCPICARPLGNDEGPMVTDEMLDRAARAVHRVTGGGIPFGKPSRRNTTRVSAALVAQVALANALEDSDGTPS